MKKAHSNSVKALESRIAKLEKQSKVLPSTRRSLVSKAYESFDKIFPTIAKSLQSFKLKALHKNVPEGKDPAYIGSKIEMSYQTAEFFIMATPVLAQGSIQNGGWDIETSVRLTGWEKGTPVFKIVFMLDNPRTRPEFFDFDDLTEKNIRQEIKYIQSTMERMVNQKVMFKMSSLEKMSSDWDDEENFNSIPQTALRRLVSQGRLKLLGFELDTDYHTGSVSWYAKGVPDPSDEFTDLAVYVAYYADKGHFEFTNGLGKVYDTLRFPKDSFDKRKFLSGSKAILTKIKNIVTRMNSNKEEALGIIAEFVNVSDDLSFDGSMKPFIDSVGWDDYRKGLKAFPEVETLFQQYAKQSESLARELNKNLRRIEKDSGGRS